MSDADLPIRDRINAVLVEHGCGSMPLCDATARAIVAAMREPTHTMYMYGGSARASATGSGKRGKRIGDDPALAVWQLMIDRALEEWG